MAQKYKVKVTVHYVCELEVSDENWNVEALKAAEGKLLMDSNTPTEGAEADVISSMMALCTEEDNKDWGCTIESIRKVGRPYTPKPQKQPKYKDIKRDPDTVSLKVVNRNKLETSDLYDVI